MNTQFENPRLSFKCIKAAKISKTLNKLIPRTHFKFRDTCNMVEKKGIILVEMFLVLFLELIFFQRNIWYRLGVGLEQEESW